MLNLSLLIVCLLFSCLALAASLLCLRRTLEVNEYRKAWKQMADRYTEAYDTWTKDHVRMDGDIDRLKDRFELHLKAFTRFRSRVTMAERREAETETVKVNTKVPGTAPLTEEQKVALRAQLHRQRYGLAPAEVPRDMTED